MGWNRLALPSLLLSAYLAATGADLALARKADAQGAATASSAAYRSDRLDSTRALHAKVDSATTAALTQRRVCAARVSDRLLSSSDALDQPMWRGAPVATDFVQTSPQPGALSRFRSEARVVYDSHALYVGLRLYDPAPDSILAPYPRRDDETTSDWVFVEIDSRLDHRSAFSLGLNPRGVQVDGTFSNDTQYDYSWDGVWDGRARIDSLGWSAVFRIPFSQLAYDGRHGPWGINFYRYIARVPESSDWSPRLPSYSGIVSHFNVLCGLTALPPARALEVTPYVALIGQRQPASPDNPFGRGAQAWPSAGADVRLGLGSGFSAIATVHPDFGQVEADPSVINLTTFETFLTERRPFFVQQASLFQYNIGLPFQTRGDAFDSDQPFYSRRIGGPPHGVVPATAAFSDLPTDTSIVGAAKLAGYTSAGWSIGALDAFTAGADAAYVDSSSSIHHIVRVEPPTSVGVVRVARDFDQGNRAIGGIITAVDRFGTAPAFDSVLPHTAYAAGVDGRYRFGAGSIYELSSFAIGSQIAGSPAAIRSVLDGPGHYLQRPGASYLQHDTTQSVAVGGAGELRLARIGGDHWRWSFVGHAISPGFDVDDAGFEHNADWLLAVGSFSYNQFTPRGWLNSWTIGSSEIGAGWDFGGERRATVVNVLANAQFSNFTTVSLSIDHDLAALSTDLLRGGPALLMPPRETIVATGTSDSRRTTQLTLTDTTIVEPATGSASYAFVPMVDFRATLHARGVIGPEYARVVNGWQFVTAGSGVYLLGRLTEQTLSLAAHLTYAFSPTLTLELYANPFTSANRYNTFRAVRAPEAPRIQDRAPLLTPAELHYDAARNTYHVQLAGLARDTLTFTNPSFTTSALNANAVLRWEFRPGSTLFAVWTQSRQGTSADDVFGFSHGVSGIFALPATNTFTVKISYWLGR